MCAPIDKIKWELWCIKIALVLIAGLLLWRRYELGW